MNEFSWMNDGIYIINVYCNVIAHLKKKRKGFDCSSE